MQAATDPAAYDPLLFYPLSHARARLRLHGRDARRFLHGMVSNDIAALVPGGGCHAALLTVKGKLLGDLVIYDCGPDAGLLIELQASAGSAVHSALDRHLIMDNATVEDNSQKLGQLGVYGQAAAAALESATGLPPGSLSSLGRYQARLLSNQSPLALVAATAELGLPGFHVIAPAEQLDAITAALVVHGGRQLASGEADTLRIEAGTPYYGIDIDEDRMPAEAGLDDAVSFSKGCYLGQEVVVRLRDRGHLNRRLCGLLLDDNGPPPLAGTRLRHPDKPAAGTITSATVSPRAGTIALGYVHRSAWAPGTTLELLGADEQPLGRTAQVVALPFAPRSR
jgi:folate-binding protein YgfZ